MSAAPPAARIIGAISSAAERWADADFPPRVRTRAGIVARTGYSEPVAEYALDRLFEGITADALAATIRSELGTVEVLDGFVASAGAPDRFARPVGRVCVISSRTTIGVALVPAVFALCAKCDVTVKDREDHFIAAFFETLCEEDDYFARVARAQPWERDRFPRPIRDYDAVAAFGTGATLQEIRNACAAEARFIPFANRASCGYVSAGTLGNSALVDVVTDGAARDLLLYDTEGCLSLHVLFIESADLEQSRAFLARLERACRQASIEFPVGEGRPKAGARRASVRDAAAFRAALGRGAVYHADGDPFVLIFDPPAGEAPELVPRTLLVIPVADPAAALAYIEAHGIALEACALSEYRPDIVRAALASGAVRLTRFGALQRPPLGSRHGGRPRIAEFVSWIDREE